MIVRVFYFVMFYLVKVNRGENRNIIFFPLTLLKNSHFFHLTINFFNLHLKLTFPFPINPAFRFSSIKWIKMTPRRHVLDKSMEYDV